MESVNKTVNNVTNEVGTNITKLVNNTIKIEEFLSNKTIFALVSVLLALYAGLIAPALPNSFIKAFDTKLGKVFFIFLIGLTASKNTAVSLMVAITFVILLHMSNKVQAEEFRNLSEKKAKIIENKKHKLNNFGTETFKNWEFPNDIKAMDKIDSKDLEKFEADAAYMEKLKKSKPNKSGYPDIETNKNSLLETFYTRQDDIANHINDDNDILDIDPDKNMDDPSDKYREKFEQLENEFDKELNKEHFTNIGVPLPKEIEKFIDNVTIPLPKGIADLDKKKKEDIKKLWEDRVKSKEEKENFVSETVDEKQHPNNPCEQIASDTTEFNKCQVAHTEAMKSCGLTTDDPIPYADTQEFAVYEETLNKVWHPEAFENFKTRELLEKLKSNSSTKEETKTENYANFVPADNLNGKNTLYAPFNTTK